MNIAVNDAEEPRLSRPHGRAWMVANIVHEAKPSLPAPSASPQDLAEQPQPGSSSTASTSREGRITGSSPVASRSVRDGER